MKLIVKTCYSHVLYMQMQGKDFADAIESFSCNRPNLEAEGFNGYIEVEVIFNIRNLQTFSKIWHSWYASPNRDKIYKMARGL